MSNRTKIRQRVPMMKSMSAMSPATTDREATPQAPGRGGQMLPPQASPPPQTQGGVMGGLMGDQARSGLQAMAGAVPGAGVRQALGRPQSRWANPHMPYQRPVSRYAPPATGMPSPESASLGPPAASPPVLDDGGKHPGGGDTTMPMPPENGGGP